MEGSILLKTFCFVLLLSVDGTVGAVCPAANTIWNSCNAGVEVITLDWTNYFLDMACHEIQIIIPADYEQDSCTWRVELANVPATISTGITVNAVYLGTADVADTLVITSERLTTQTVEFSGSLDDMYNDPHDSSVPAVMTADGQADAVEISFTRPSPTAFSGGGFTLRVVLYAKDEATVCGSISSPNMITLTEDYPKAALATPNFAGNYPMGASCYTNIVSPPGTQITVDYIYQNLVVIQDNVMILDTTNPTAPCILRVETAVAIDGRILDQKSFESRTNRMQIAFVDTLTAERAGVLLLFSTAPAYTATTACDMCDCTLIPSGTATPECEAATSNGFVDIMSMPAEQPCNTETVLDWTENDSYLFLATPGYNTAGYTDTDTCKWTVTGPTNSNLLVIFKDMDLAARDSVYVAPGSNIGRIFRISGASPTIDFYDGSGMASLAVVGAEIVALSNRVTVGLITSAADSAVGQGASFEVRVIDNRCIPRCVNGGQCNCVCVSGYRGITCANPIPITLTLNTAPPITEGSPFEVICRAAIPLVEETSIVLEVDSTSTAFEGAEYDFVVLSSYPCIVPAGGRSCTMTITTIDDTIMEMTENIVLKAGTISGGGAPDAADGEMIMIQLQDTPDTILLPVEFSSSFYTVLESDLTFTGTIEFKRLNTYHAIPETGTIDLAYTLGTASASDFTQISTVAFVQSSQPMTSTVLFEIPINDDSLEESIETFDIFLSVSSSTILTEGTVSRATVRIQDDDHVDNIVVIDIPEIPKHRDQDVHIFAFSSSNLGVTWTKEDSRKPKFTRADLIIDGTQYGETFTFPLSDWMPERRLGHYTFTFGSNEAINGFVKVTSECLSLRGNCTTTVYPRPSDNSRLSSVLELSVAGTNCPTDIKWEKDGQEISNTGTTYTVNTRAAADGIFTMFRRNNANRQNKGWFAMAEVIVSDCPANTYKDGTGSCTMPCPNCRNGGVCELDGTCSCPPCFTGSLCEIKQSEAGTFGTNRRFRCSALHTDVSARENCEGFLFCPGGLYGCSCGCGWRGSDCKEGCDDGFYGADCKQRCTTCTIAQCDPFTGCP
ncbi:Tyrosine-protein kinase receptor Tie-1 [Holothuria leucospilota]|uniref:Tyrosine-protein kinase receptor Tie-1 n=1 Tax=Holothuria leucospilota TaxID=206669 RepID=A0A9Q0YKF8_HOLLE|nr:Tyrosine-protein kinase receptor Tie-1 [Holothuria leucospilota]